MTDPTLDALQTAAVRRLDRGAPQRTADLADARNQALGIGPDRDAVTMATVLREGGPARPRLTRALVALAADTYRKLHRTPAPSSPPQRSAVPGKRIQTEAGRPAPEELPGRVCSRCGYHVPEGMEQRHLTCPDTGGVAGLAR